MPCSATLSCQHLLSTSHSAFSISTTLPPPLAPILPFPLPLPLSAHSCPCGFSSPLPLRLVEQQSRWVFSSCYDLRDDNGSYNVASRSWCGWACGGLCCVKAGDSAREGEEETEAGLGLSANHSAGSTSVSSAVFSLPLLFLVFSLFTHWLLLARLLSFSGKLCFQYLAMFL